MHVDMDAFFASVEQLDHSEYKGHPVIVGSLSNVGVFTLRAFFGTNHMYGWCHSFCSKVEYVL